MMVATYIDRFFETLFGWFGIRLFAVGDSMITPGGLLRVAVILTIAWWVSKIMREALERVARYRPTMSRSSIYTLGRLVHYTVMSIGLVLGVSSLGIDLNKFALFASALGVGVGFGLQTLISNFVAGLMLLFDRTLKVGDFVDLESGVTGEVKEINIRSTVVTTNDNVDVVVPNAQFVNGRVTNWTMRDTIRRTKISFGVAFASDKEQVRDVVLAAAAGVKTPGRVHADYLWAIHTALQEAGIEIPYPQRDINIRSWKNCEHLRYGEP